jgi:hypothetical protein
MTWLAEVIAPPTHTLQRLYPTFEAAQQACIDEIKLWLEQWEPEKPQYVVSTLTQYRHAQPDVDSLRRMLLTNTPKSIIDQFDRMVHSFYNPRSGARVSKWEKPPPPRLF